MGIRTRFTAALACALVATTTAAQRDRGHVALRQAVRDANNDRSIALIATHPDDQWILAASYLRFHLGFRVAVILCTRGEGGQNITGPEVGDALGRIRTLETETCAARLDCEVWYLNRTDDGYSRSGTEALETWGRDGTTRDLARILRAAHPDIVVTTHNPTETHGHDQALLEILTPAVELAESEDFAVDGLAPIRVHRLFRGADPDRPDIRLPADTMDADRGLTYLQIAKQAIDEHRSQYPIRPDVFPNELLLRSLPIRGRSAEPSLSQGLPTVFDALREIETRSALAKLRRGFEELIERLEDRQGLLESALALRESLIRIDVPEGSDAAIRIERRVRSLERIVRHAVALDATVRTPRGIVAVPGEPLPFELVAHHVPDLVTDVQLVSHGAAVVAVDDARRDGTSAHFEGTLTLPSDFEEFESQRFLGDRYEQPVSVQLEFTARHRRGTDATLRVPIVVPVEVRPAVEFELFPSAILVPAGMQSVAFAVRVRRNTQEPLDDFLSVKASLGVQPTPIAHRVSMAGERLREYRFRLDLPVGSTTMRARVRLGKWSKGLVLHRQSVAIDPTLRVGLIRGVDDAARLTLRAFGVQLVELTESVLPTRELSDLDTIVVDIRALRSHEAAQAGFNRLVDFVRAGGRLVVLYHKDQEFNLASSGFRGYPPELPLHVGKGRVTEEDRPVEVLMPDHPLMTRPNRIRTSDWDGWVQERGLYFPSIYSDDFDEILAMSDTGMTPELGSLLYGRTGQGEFVYCALALHRQLKNLHPGACRLFANLITPAIR